MLKPADILPLTHAIAPADEAAVAAAVAAAARSGTPIYPIGGGTQLGYGARPVRPGIALSTAGLTRILDYPAEDMTITVEAGITVAEVSKRLATRQQWLPINVAQADRATVGGVVATNTNGPRRYGYGTIRDYVIGLRAVDGSGKAFGGGGRVVKNAAGYNIPRLLVGSLGTLGVTTQVTLMVRPAPETSALVVADAADWDAAECLLMGLGRTQTLPVAVELLAGTPRQDCPAGVRVPAGYAARVAVGFDGSADEVQWTVGQIRQEWRGIGVDSVATFTGGVAKGLWSWFVEAPADVQVHVLPCDVVAMTAMLLDLAPGCSIQAHAGNGVVRVQLPSPLPPGEGQGEGAVGECSGGVHPFTAFLRDTFRPAVADEGGRLVVLSHPADAGLTTEDVWGPAGDGAAISAAIKKRYDPRNILNPGRFIFGK